eukprot:CAMPEP_0173215994 /NCGR_PEP_ID=MMETSP1141-20130122/26783_1 /TAXON_ID=483371 /ORGANISM="non described non described, Strain CCMP2298" /LENGTH=125 /DNA_ID=CAMNT_0014143423 /DNA_START=179 /DNA_END=556 /DNA_ORIENTATION=+
MVYVLVSGEKLRRPHHRLGLGYLSHGGVNETDVGTAYLRCLAGFCRRGCSSCLVRHLHLLTQHALSLFGYNAPPQVVQNVQKDRVVLLPKHLIQHDHAVVPAPEELLPSSRLEAEPSVLANANGG